MAFVRVLENGPSVADYKAKLLALIAALVDNGKLFPVESGDGDSGYSGAGVSLFDPDAPYSWGVWRTRDSLGAVIIQMGLTSNLATIRVCKGPSCLPVGSSTAWLGQPGLKAAYDGDNQEYVVGSSGSPHENSDWWTTSSVTDPMVVMVAPESDDPRFFCVGYSDEDTWFGFFYDVVAEGVDEDIDKGVIFWGNGNGAYPVYTAGNLWSDDPACPQGYWDSGVSGVIYQMRAAPYAANVFSGGQTLLPADDGPDTWDADRVTTAPMVYGYNGAAKSFIKGRSSFLRWRSTSSGAGFNTGRMKDDGTAIIFQHVVFTEWDGDPLVDDPSGETFTERALFSGGGGGGDSTPPAITNLTPADTTDLEPDDYVEFDLSDASDLGLIELLCTLSNDPYGRHTIYDEGQFWGLYRQWSTVTGAGTGGDPYHFKIRPSIGWPRGVTVNLLPRVVDVAGNVQDVP